MEPSLSCRIATLVYFYILLLRIFSGTPVPPNDWILDIFLVNAITPSAIHVIYSPNCKGTSVAACPWACYFDVLDIATFFITGTVFRFWNGEVREAERIRLTRGPPLLWCPAYVATRNEKYHTGCSLFDSSFRLFRVGI